MHRYNQPGSNFHWLHPFQINIQQTLNYIQSFINSATKNYTLYNQAVLSHFWQGFQLFQGLLPKSVYRHTDCNTTEI